MWGRKQQAQDTLLSNDADVPSQFDQPQIRRIYSSTFYVPVHMLMTTWSPSLSLCVDQRLPWFSWFIIPSYFLTPWNLTVFRLIYRVHGYLASVESLEQATVFPRPAQVQICTIIRALMRHGIWRAGIMKHHDYSLLIILSFLQFITTGVGTTTVLRSLSSYQMLAGVLGTKLEYIHQPRTGEDPERYPHLVFFLSAMCSMCIISEK